MAGIYIHIPFCKQKCTYCDFHFSTTFHRYRNRMVKAICRELELRKDYLANQVIETIYFGGGTPSILLKEELEVILETIDIHYVKSFSPEVTLEANPDDISSTSVVTWKQLGINRLSIGLQSFKESDLKWMNRAHNVDDSYQCVKTAIAGGIDNLTVDLMYGLPDLSNEEWVEHINTVIDLGVQHVSAYCLTVEEGTALDHFVENGKIVTPSEDLQAEQFLLLVDTLQQHGIEQYEISNFAREGFQSKHNSNYWKGVHYLGIGPSAHSFNGASRSWNIAHNQKYMTAIEEEQQWYDTETLSPKDVFNELILTGLRTTFGVDLNQLEKIKLLDESFLKKVNHFVNEALMVNNNNRLVLTKLGRLQADYIASELFQ